VSKNRLIRPVKCVGNRRHQTLPPVRSSDAVPGEIGNDKFRIYVFDKFAIFLVMVIRMICIYTFQNISFPPLYYLYLNVHYNVRSVLFDAVLYLY